MYQSSLLRRLVYFNTLIDIIKIWGLQEVGSDEVDVEAVANYLESNCFMMDQFDFHSIEDIQTSITNDIVGGLPVWNFLKLSDWTRNMLLLTYKEKSEKRAKALVKKYKCLQGCKFYERVENEFGFFELCHKNDKVDNNPQHGFRRPRGESTLAHYKCKCDSYAKK